MSDNKYNPNIPSKFANSNQKIRDLNLAADIKSQLQKKFDPKDNSPEARLIQKAMDVTTKVREAVKPIVAAGGWKDQAAIRHLIMTLYLESFDTPLLFTKDDLVQVCAIIHTDLMMETIEADPTLSGTPDKLSGK